MGTSSFKKVKPSTIFSITTILNDQISNIKSNWIHSPPVTSETFDCNSINRT